MFSIVFRYYVYPGQYVLKFTHKGSPDLFSSTLLSFLLSKSSK